MLYKKVCNRVCDWTLKQKRLIFIIEVLVAMVLLLAVIYKALNPTSYMIDMSNWSSDYMSWKDGSWVISDSELLEDSLDQEEVVDNQDAEKQDSIDIILTSDNIHLDADSYTIQLTYHSNNQVKCYLSNVGRGLHANKFFLSKNKDVAIYDFFTIKDIGQFQINITDYSGGDFALESVIVTTNSINMRLLLLVWVIFCCLLDFVLYSLFFKKHKKTIVALLVLSALVSVANTLYGIHIGHDLTFHLQRIEGIAQGLAQGQFPVRMNTTFNDGYGYPVGVFYGDLLLYIPALLRLIGLPILTTYKAYIWLVNLLTLIAAYYMGRVFFGKRRLSLLVALAYTASSYRLMDIYVRSAVGEYTALIFLPIIATAFYRIYTEDVENATYQRNAITLALGMAGLLYTHILTTEMAVLLAIVTAIIFIKRTIRKETLLLFIKAAGMCLALGMCYIIPFLDYYLLTDTMVKTSGQTAATIQQGGGYISQYFAFFRTVYGASEVEASLRMQLTPGLLLMLTFIVALVVVVIRKADKRICFLSFMSLLTLFMASNIFPWDTISQTSLGNMLAAVQFPWRYLGFGTLFMSLLLGCLIEKIPTGGWLRIGTVHIMALLALVVVVTFVVSYRSGVSYLCYVDTLEIPSHIGVDTNGKEYLLQGTDIELLDYEVKASSGKAVLISEDGLSMTISVATDTSASVEIPRFAYPYYKAVTNSGEELDITAGTNNKLTVEVPGDFDGTITISYIEPLYWRLAELVSVISVIILIVLGVRKGIR